MSRILLVRHCESSGQHAEAPLSERGFAQADALAAMLAAFPTERIVSSPYLRARQTIAPFAARARLELELDARLAERRLSAEPMPDWRDFVRASFDDLELRAPGGESGGETLARGRAAFADALARGRGLTALVGHASTCRFAAPRRRPLRLRRLAVTHQPDLYLLETNARGGHRARLGGTA
jgi:2,3-bisphosphoglycerate-dependent phosphoglycerate mutase